MWRLWPKNVITQILQSLYNFNFILDWELHWDHDGKVIDCDELIKKIFQGGIEHNIRSEVWKFLLGYHSFDSTLKEREDNRKLKVHAWSFGNQFTFSVKFFIQFVHSAKLRIERTLFLSIKIKQITNYCKIFQIYVKFPI